MLTVSKVARAGGVSAKAVRLYEAAGCCRWRHEPLPATAHSTTPPRCTLDYEGPRNRARRNYLDLKAFRKRKATVLFEARPPY